MYEIDGDFEDLQELVKGIKLAEPALKRATAHAVNRTANSVRSLAAKMISADYKVTQRDIKKELKISKANFTRQVATIVGSGSPGIPLSKFSPTPNRVPSTIHKKGVWVTRQRFSRRGAGKFISFRAMVEGTDKYLPRTGIKVMVTRGKRKLVRTAFVARMSSGHVGVFRRVKDGRVGLRSKRVVIEELYGPSPLRLIEQDRYQIAMDDHAGDEMEKNMARAANYYLKKYKVIPDA